MRTGNLRTPCRASRSPRAAPGRSGSRPGSACSMLIIPLNRAVNSSASATVRPATASLIMEAEAWEMEHPCPVTPTATISSPSKAKSMWTSSPHNGLEPSAEASGSLSFPRLRGLR